VDTVRFAPVSLPLGRTTREIHKIPSNAVVIGFLGRVTRDKGVDELARAFEIVCRHLDDAILLIVGGYEHRDHPSPATMETFSTHPRVRHVGWVPDVLPLMAAMDIFVLPTRREGLPNVLLEAAALGLPTVTTDATGARDAIIPERTGLLVPIADIERLSAALIRLASNPTLRQEMGRAGRQWVTEHFKQIDVWEAQANEYRALARRTAG
jgi:glycosyltransferase involved in cell wall biosynthesis